MNKKETEEIRNRLKSDRKNILEKVERIKDKETSYLNDEVGDDVDRAAGNSQREILFYLNEHDCLKLDAVEDALNKIDSKRYGICEECNKKITKERLKAMPHARLCIKCKPVRENHSEG